MSYASDVLTQIKLLPRKNLQSIAVCVMANIQYVAASNVMAKPGKPAMARLFVFKDHSFLEIDFERAPKVDFQIGEVRGDGADVLNPENRRILQTGEMTDPVKRTTQKEKEITLAHRKKIRGH